jgi:hypothetical protein
MIAYFFTERVLDTDGCDVSIDLNVNIDGSVNVDITAVTAVHLQVLVKAV